MSDRLLRVIPAADACRRRNRAVDPETFDAARVILDDVFQRGESAALEHARRLGDLREGERHIHDTAALSAARDRLPRWDREVLERTAGRIRDFALAQRAGLRDFSMRLPGGEAGHTCLPVRSAGCYAPGGRFPLPSSVLMTAVTARAAGVTEVWVASPRPTDATLAAAAIAGAHGLLAIGGVQAIGAMARGLFGLPACDMIVGPGNRWVTAAKQLVSSEVGIDMLAGPSELVILADVTADPRIVAADLLAQAEHDDDAVPILISTSEALIEAVEGELHRQLPELPTRATAAKALLNGFAVASPSVDGALRLCESIAPEHLEIMMEEAAAIADRIVNAGAVFIGAASAEAFGDYGAGPNHVLPTGGTARFRAGLSVFTFLRARTWLRIDGAAASRSLAEDAKSLARMESLEAHARSIEVRSA